jgi:hypothetical protein
MARHGRVARTRVSPRDPAVLPGARKPVAAATAVVGGRDHAGRDELVRLAEALLVEPTDQQRSRQRRGLARVLGWLESFPGEGWQDRWLLAGADQVGTAWGPAGLTAGQRQRLTAGLAVLIVLRAVRPSYSWLCGSRLLGVYAAFRQHNHAGVFAELERTASTRGAGEYAAEALNLLTRMVIVTGKDPRELNLADFNAYADARRDSGRTVAALPFAYEILHAAGGLQGLPATLRQARSRGQLPVAELVDRYSVTCRPVRDELVHYLTERAAALDYGSLVNQVQVLVALFWVDLECHHPGIGSLHLPDSVAQAWKQRVRTLPSGRARRGVHTVLLMVRAFYLDLRQWSLEDPARWAAWAAPCPIGEADVRGYVKETRQRQARMQQRTRTLIPVLPRLVTAAGEHLERARQLLDTIREPHPGRRRYRRDRRPDALRNALPTRARVRSMPDAQDVASPAATAAADRNQHPRAARRGPTHAMGRRGCRPRGEPASRWTEEAAGRTTSAPRRWCRGSWMRTHASPVSCFAVCDE